MQELNQTENRKMNTRAKRIPKQVQPSEGLKLVTVRNYATKNGITTTRVYQKFQEGNIEIVAVDGVQFVNETQEQN